MPANADWYDDPADPTRLRYWDGTAWTEHYAEKSRSAVKAAVKDPKPAGTRRWWRRSTADVVPVVPPAAAPRSWRASTIVVLAVLACVTLASVATGGPAGLFIFPGLFALATGAYVLLTGRKSWLRLSGRRLGIGVLAGGLVALMVGGGVASATGYGSRTPDAASIALASPAAAKPAGKKTQKPTSTPSATPSPTPTATVELDPDVTAASTGTAVVAASAPSGSSVALDLLATLAVKGRAPKTGYDRTGDFGTAWLDVDRNGCDTRNDILQRDLADKVLSGPCRVLSGKLADPYTGKTINFVRGNTTSTLVQIDHVVALMDAWQKGAQQLTYDQRVSLANDPLNLFAVDGPTNSRKSDGDAATWLPANKAFRCTYVARQVAVKATYGLWVTQAEHDAIANVLAACPGEQAPTSRFTPVPPPPAPAPAPVFAPAPVVEQPAPAPVVEQPAPAPVAAPAPAAPADVYYANCSAARAAGAAPVYAGQPGYSPKLDRDGDGVGCE